MDNSSENKERHVLVINTGAQKAYALEAAAYSLGRDSTNAIVLDFDTVSREHALLLRVPNPNTKRYEYRIIDGNAEGKVSANGLYINGEAVKSQTLKNGDCVKFGHHVTASYLMLSMGETEFMNYLESISYQSLKREVVDEKATLVGGLGFDAMFSDDASADLGTEIPGRQSGLPPGKVPKWQETLHDSDKAQRDLQKLRNGTKSEKSPFRLWMLMVGGLLALVIAGAALLVVQQSQTQPAQPTSSGTSLKSTP